MKKVTKKPRSARLHRGAAPKATLESLAAPHTPRELTISSDLAQDVADMVNHPPHYQRGGVECVNVLEAMVTGWSPQTAVRLGQAFEYLFRHAHKGEAVQDLEKAQWWIQREIDALKAKQASGAQRHG